MKKTLFEWGEALLFLLYLLSMYALGMSCVWAWATLTGSL